MSLHKLLEKANSPFLDSSKEWYTYVVDMIPDIRRTSKILTIPAYERTVYKYRLVELLRELKLDPNIAPIVVLLNGWNSTADYSGQNDILIPDINHLQELRKVYQKHKSK